MSTIRTKNFDFIIIGAGILGLSLARELLFKYPSSKIAIVEKEQEIGLHASGRNSGVLHSGIYYKTGSLKAKLCLSGAREMAKYCDERGLPISRIGKLIVPQKIEDLPVLEDLYQRALNNGASVQMISGPALLEMEPYLNSKVEKALYSPETTVVNPKAILKSLFKELSSLETVSFFFNHAVTKISTSQRSLICGDTKISYQHLFNTAGLYADKIAKECGLSDSYQMIPFKGLYFELSDHSKLNINHLIYPVPDMNVPFLGIHFTKSIGDKIYIGPTAIPALGRENYCGVKGIRLSDASLTLFNLTKQYLNNKQGFRNYTHQELLRFIPHMFLKSAQSLIPSIQSRDIQRSSKVGIRAQLLDLKAQELVMDFLVSNTSNETHVLNAVSPGFTSAFTFSRYILENIKCS